HVRRIPERAPDLRGAIENPKVLSLRGGAVEIRHPHAAQPNCRHTKALGSKSVSYLCAPRACSRGTTLPATGRRRLPVPPNRMANAPDIGRIRSHPARAV